MSRIYTFLNKKYRKNKLTSKMN